MVSIWHPKGNSARKRMTSPGEMTQTARGDGEPPVVLPRLVEARWVENERFQIELRFNKPVFGTHVGFSGTYDNGAGPQALSFSLLSDDGSAIRNLAHAEGVQAGTIGSLSYSEAAGNLQDAEGNPVGDITDWMIQNQLWPVWDGFIPNFNIELLQPFSHDMAQYTDQLAQAPYSYSTVFGGLPTGLSWNGSVVQGTPQSVVSGQQWRAGASNGSYGPAESNLVTWDVFQPPTVVGTIPNMESVQNANITPFDASSVFESSEPMTYSEVGTWPTGITVDSVTGIISGAAPDPGTYTNLQVQAANGLGSALSNNFQILVTASSLQVLINHLGETLVNDQGEELTSVFA